MPAWLDHIVGEAHETLRLSSGKTAQLELGKRGVSESDILEHRIGYAGPSLTFTDAPQDFFNWAWKFLHHCLVFPLYSPSGVVIGIQIRSLQEDTTSRPYKQFYAYKDNVHPYMFGIPQALPEVFLSKSIIIVEGIFDYFAVRQHNSSVVAVLTSGVPNPCRRFFRRFTNTVICLLDMDAPGRDGAVRLQTSAVGYNVIIPSYSEKDPDELRKRGKHGELARLASLANILLPGSPHV